jgi:hypothetical protein
MREWLQPAAIQSEGALLSASFVISPGPAIAGKAMFIAIDKATPGRKCEGFYRAEVHAGFRGLDGGRCRDRTCGPSRVKGVLYR